MDQKRATRALQENKIAELFGVMPEEMSDGMLMVRVASGDEEAFRQLIERHQDRVYGTVARMMGGAGPEAEEAAQDVFFTGLEIGKSVSRGQQVHHLAHDRGAESGVYPFGAKIEAERH